MPRQKQPSPVRAEVVALAYAVDGALVRALACTLLLATTLVAATLAAF